MRLLLLTSVLCTALSVRAISERRCYFPDGSIDTDGYVCNQTAAANGEGSACCLHNDACYQTGTCFQDWSGVTYRQSCTDQSWKSPACPQYCTSAGVYTGTRLRLSGRSGADSGCGCRTGLARHLAAAMRHPGRESMLRLRWQLLHKPKRMV